MSKPIRALVLYITERSGHHRAALSVARALEAVAPGCTVTCLNAFRYVFPVADRVIHKIYMAVIRRSPAIWEKMYDNPRVVTRSGRIKQFVHRLGMHRMKRLMDETRPHVVVCTQAFPCGLAAEFKRRTRSPLTLVAVLTDFAPHAFWIYDEVDHYVVACEEAREKLRREGVPIEKIHMLGIPIDSVFAARKPGKEIYERFGLSSELPVVMIMGGGHGLGPIRDVVTKLDASPISLQIVLVCGINKGLFAWARQRAFRHRVAAFEYVDHIDELMSISSVLVTKPGGITSAEALAMTLPMVIMSPIPGQETRNTQLLVKYEAARRAEGADEVFLAVMDILLMHKRRYGIFSFWYGMNRLARPRAATDIARLCVRSVP
ncbi:MAG: MGDG synthase family glycosyltransferase [Deltaproteobacteria bacterium]